MSRLTHLALVFVLLAAVLPAAPALAQTPTLPPNCVAWQGSFGAFNFYCAPPPGEPVPWNGDLIVFAHGYVNPEISLLDQPYPWDQLVLPDGSANLVELVNGLGYAFAASGYSKNGLAVLHGLQDTLDMVNTIKVMNPAFTGHVFLAGASEGGLVATLGMERYPDVFDAGLALCGPLGNFQKQINYWGDFRVVFDYLFPSILPPSPVAIPPELMENWMSFYAPTVAGAIGAYPTLTSQLLRVTGAPFDPLRPASIQESVLGLLWYNVYATNDGISTLGGQPFKNINRRYKGSYNDFRLNKTVQRFKADPGIAADIAKYQTSGILGAPLVSLHTTGDPIVPYWHMPLYRMKVFNSGSAPLYTAIPVLRYGHCAFTQVEVLAAFSVMVMKATNQPLTPALGLLPDAMSEAKFLELVNEYEAWR